MLTNKVSFSEILLKIIVDHPQQMEAILGFLAAHSECRSLLEPLPFLVAPGLLHFTGP